MYKNIAILLLCYVILLQSIMGEVFLSQARHIVAIKSDHIKANAKIINENIKIYEENMRQYTLYRDAVDDMIYDEFIPKEICVVVDQSRFEY